MGTDTIDAPREIVSFNPANGAQIGSVQLMGATEVCEAIKRARAAQPAWASLTFRQRGRVITKARQIILEELDGIAALISSETGKPAAEAISMEIVPTLDLMHYFAATTARLLSPQKIDIGLYGFMGRTSRVIYKPVGVVGIISPWNFPWATPLDEVVMALMAGNAVVLKPSEMTPFVALKIADVFKLAQLPAGLLEVVTGDGSTGATLVDAGVDKIMFTGSVATGKRVAEAAARNLTPTVLELGGKDPMIVLADANLANAARAAVWGAFANAGQACASVERCYVQEAIAEEFIEAVVNETRALRSGANADQPDVGAMINEHQLHIVEEHIKDAVAHGARVLVGGHRATDPKSLFHEPTVITRVNQSMKIMSDETFGPVLPIMTFQSDDEAVQLANDSVFGLTASVWTNNIDRGRRLAERIEAGTVMVNEVVYTHALAQTPWGGVKHSGYGRTHGRLGLLELVTPQHIHVNRMPWIPDVWWFGYSLQASKLFHSLARRFTTGSLFQSCLLIPAFLRRLFERRR